MTSETNVPVSQTPIPPSASGRRFGAGTLVAVALASAGLASGGAYLLFGHAHDGRANAAPEPAKPAKERYQCPMHPTIVQDHPGDCPICGMKLVKMDGAKQAAPEQPASAGAERRILFYRSQMDPKQTSPTPRKDEMGMDYLPAYADEAGGSSPAVERKATVDIDPARQQLVGLRTAEVSPGEVGGAWRTVGRVAIDETRVQRINLKIPGFVERISVDFVGKPVKKGDPLFSIYSPELLSAQEEYLLALRTRRALSGGAGALSGDGDALVAAARRKLALWDVPEAGIDRVVRTGEPTKALTFRSAVSGVVTKKDVVQGMKLDAGAMPYEIVDLSSVWVLADVYESELRFVKEGMAASLTLKAFPNREFRGRVLFIDPLLDPQTRTVKVRLAFPNPGGALRPEMFGEVVLHGSPRQGLRIPLDAVVDSGTEKIVAAGLGGSLQQNRLFLAVTARLDREAPASPTPGRPPGARRAQSQARLRANECEAAASNPGLPSCWLVSPPKPARQPSRDTPGRTVQWLAADAGAPTCSAAPLPTTARAAGAEPVPGSRARARPASRCPPWLPRR